MFTIWALIPLVTSLTYIILLVMALQYARRRVNKVFAIFLAIAAFWSFTSFMLHLNAFPAQALLWNQLLVIALIWTMIAYYHFIRAYTNQPGGKGLYLGYALVAVLAALSLSGYIVQYSYVVDGVLFHSLGASIYFIGAISLAFAGAIIFQLVRKYRNSSDPADRNRTMYLVVGWSVLAVLSYTNLIPAVAGLPMDHVGGIINVSIIAYAIMRYQLLNIRFVARRGLAYLLVIICLGGVYAGSIVLVQNLFPAQTAYGVVLLAAVLAMLLAFMARPLRYIVEEGIDRLFYHRTYDYRQALLDFSKRMSHTINLDELAAEMLSMMTKALHVTQAKLLFPDWSSGDFTTQFTYPKVKGELTNEIKFSVDNPLVTWMNKENEPLNMDLIDNTPEFKGLWTSEKEEMTASDLRLLCPIKSQDRLVGILALGRKRPDTLYSHEDLELVMRTASQVGAMMENAQRYSHAIIRANTDGLTGLYNHRHFHERLEQEIARGSRFGNSFSLIMLDADLFKAYNDIHGHVAGDEILRKIAMYIKMSIRSLDMAFRYGGEEFAVILPEAQLSDAYKVAERVRNTIATKISSRAMPITVSLGIANWPDDGVMREEIISRADAALYLAKQLGRNRTCLSSEVTESAVNPIGIDLEAQSRAMSIIYALAATVDAKDHYTYGHSKKVSDYAVMLAEGLGLSQDKVTTMRAAGLLHDIGKVGIPDAILNKDGPLTEEEWKPIRAHPKLGVEILRHVIDLAKCLPAILHHHENYNGGGYLSGLKGDNIPMEARILAIADAYDAITSIRPYHQQLSSQQAVSELRRCAGTQFDPEMVTIFCKVIEQTHPKSLEIK